MLEPSLIAGLQPGDSLNILPGSYDGFVVEGLHGLPGQEIVIRGAPGAERHAVTIRGDSTGRRDTLELIRSSHLILENLRVIQAPRSGIRVNNSHHVQIRDSLLESNGVWGIFTNHANHFSAHGNTIFGPARQHGIYHSNSGDYVRITGNLIAGFNGSGIHMNGDLSMGGAPGVAADGVISQVEILDNYIAGNGDSGGSAINLDGVELAHIEGNFLVGNKATGIAVFKADGGIGSRNVSALRNLLVMAPGSRWAVVISDSGGACLFSENIIVVQNPRRGIYHVSDDALVVPDEGAISGLPFLSDSSIYFTPRSFALLNDRERFGFRFWQLRGQDRESSTLELFAPIELNAEFGTQLPNSIQEAMKELGIAVENPYRNLLGVAQK